MKLKVVESDVLCVGGGIGGLMAAIRAAELGSKVTVVDKSNTLRSGAGATGNDHFACYIPEVHGPEIRPVIAELRLGQMAGRLKNPDVVRVWFERAFEIVKLWEAWGIPMKYQGRYEFAGHTFPGHSYPAFFKYAGQAQKIVLTEQALKRGAQIINRVMVFDLLGDGEAVVGAIGVGTRDEEIVEFRARSILLGTGALRRLYPGPTPGWMFNISFPGSTCGDGRAMAYRAGAELVNMEMPARHAGPKYFARQGQGSWVGIIRDAKGNPVGPFLTRPDRHYSDMIIEVNKSLFADAARMGRPVYMDCRGISDEDYEYMRLWLNHEGNAALLNHLQEEGIDIRQHPVEFMTFELCSAGMLRCNEKAETNVKGLYAIGDEVLGGISAAATFGWVAGEQAAEYARKAVPPGTAKAEPSVNEKKTWLEKMSERAAGPDWREANVALQQVMNDYAGLVRSEDLLTAGLNHLRRVKARAHKTMVARNQHELSRALEVLNLFELGELVFTAALERRETRGMHVRTDYPFTNPLLDKTLVAKKVKGYPAIEWRT